MCVSDSFPVPGAGGGGAGVMAVLVETCGQRLSDVWLTGHYPDGQTVGEPVGRTAHRPDGRAREPPTPAKSNRMTSTVSEPDITGPQTTYAPAADRYDDVDYRRCGRSGLMLPPISLGLWQNFGDDRPLATSRAILRRAFDLGITHFDLANNYGPAVRHRPSSTSGGSSPRTSPRLRHELVISTKAGYDMWPGPYGDHGSRKYLLDSLDQSLARMRLDHVDIFYSHRFDPDTPLEETMGALDTAVRSGQGSVCRDLELRPRADARGGRDPAPAGDAAADPPAVVLDVQPLGRARAARRARARGHRLHRLLAARPGPADRQVPRRDPGRLARSARAGILETRC